MVTKRGPKKKRGRDYFGWSQKCCDNSGGQACWEKNKRKSYNDWSILFTKNTSILVTKWAHLLTLLKDVKLWQQIHNIMDRQSLWKYHQFQRPNRAPVVLCWGSWWIWCSTSKQEICIIKSYCIPSEQNIVIHSIYFIYFQCWNIPTHWNKKSA